MSLFKYSSNTFQYWTISNLSTDRWEKWASIIIGYPEISGVTGEDETFLEIIKQAYEEAPQEVIDTLLILINKENEKDKDNILFILRKVEDCLDKQHYFVKN